MKVEGVHAGYMYIVQNNIILAQTHSKSYVEGFLKVRDGEEVLSSFFQHTFSLETGISSLISPMPLVLPSWNSTLDPTRRNSGCLRNLNWTRPLSPVDRFSWRDEHNIPIMNEAKMAH